MDLALDLGVDGETIHGEGGEQVKAWIQQNYLKVDVYYKSLNVRRVRQSALYSVSYSLKHNIRSNSSATCFCLSFCFVC